MNEEFIHPTAIISPETKIGQNVRIGAYSVIGPNATIGNDVDIKSHVVITGYTQIGDNTTIYPFACLGDPPQILNHSEDFSELIIGEHNHIGHYVTMNGGTRRGNLITKIGDHCMFMDSSHVGHDSEIGNHVTITNAVLIAGHVQIEDYAIIGGGAVISQYIRIGKAAMIAGGSGIANDVIPYGYAEGYRATLDSLNIIGMKRLGISKQDMHALFDFYRVVLCKNPEKNEPLQVKLEKYQSTNSLSDQIKEVMRFIEMKSHKTICLPAER